MESLISRYRNVSILLAVLFAQVLGLAVQVRRAADSESTRLIRIWAVGSVTPFEKAIVWAEDGVSNLWRSYVYLRGVRQENRDLKYELENLRLKEVRLSEDAAQARRLQALLGFKEQFIMKTLAAQVIGFTGSDLSRGVYIDKGHNDGVRTDMAVITAEGVVGKVLRVYNSTSLVLLINDQTSGVGAILENSRLQGILRGTPAGKVVLEKILSDEQVQPGEPVQTSGGDQIFPKGLPAGVVSSVSRGPDTFLEIHVHPAADLSKLEEVLVITEQEKRVPVAEASTPMRAVDVLAQRLPSVPDKPPSSPATEAGPATNQATPAAKPAANAPTRANKSSGAAREAGMKAAATPPKPAPKPNSAAAAKTPPKPAASTDQAAQPNPESGNPPQ